MKRDMDLIRDILRFIEDRDAKDVGVELPGRSLEELRLHLKLMQDVGWVEGLTFTRESAICTRLTMQGYEVLESTRNDTIWNKAKAITIEKTGGLSLAALGEALKQLVKIAIDAVT